MIFIRGRSSALNGSIDGLAAELNTTTSPVVVVDQHSDFSVSEDTFDDVHPDASGEEKMAQKWLDAILTYVK